MTHVDVIIIGAGPGGYETAVLSAKAGLSTVVVESDKLGGTCLNVGCIPTKCLCHTASVLQEIKNSSSLGIKADGVTFNLHEAMERKNRVISQLAGGIEALLKTPLITSIKGKASFIDSHSIKVMPADTTTECPETEFTAPSIIIATGSVPKFLPIEGKDIPGVLTSTELLEIDSVPARLCIIGGGVIGIEFASIFNAFGSHVTVVEYCKEILPNFDSDIAKRLRLSLKARGIEFQTGAAVNVIRRTESGLETGYLMKGTQQTTTADVILMAVGRGPNLRSLNLDDVGIEYDKRGVKTDENLQTNIPGVYAIGDINGKVQLAHAAYAQGRVALAHIMGKPSGIRLDIMPAAVFSSPEAACVGLSQDQCKAQGIDVRVGKSFFRSNGKALAINDTDGMLKLLSDPDGKILGCHIFGPHASDLIQEVAALMNKNASVDDLRRIIHGHPTLSEVVQKASEA